jgi:hypothetical protein
MKGIGEVAILSVSAMRGRQKAMVEKAAHAIKNFDG